MKKQNILVPIDFTEISEAGLKTAMDIASQIDANIQLLHIIQEHANLGFKTDADMESHAIETSQHNHFMVELIKKTKLQFENLIETYKNDKIKLIPFVEFGDYEEKLNTHLDENHVDMVVMGSSGETNISEFFSGNHTTQAIRIADVPVLAVKQYYPIITKDNLLILVSLKEYDFGKVSLIKKFADVMQLKVTIGHVKQKKDVVKEDILEELKKFALDNNFIDSHIHIIGKGEKVEAIKDFVKQHDINLIASITEGDSGITRFIFGSDTEDFLAEIDRPLLAIND